MTTGFVEAGTRLPASTIAHLSETRMTPSSGTRDLSWWRANGEDVEDHGTYLTVRCPVHGGVSLVVGPGIHAAGHALLDCKGDAGCTYDVIVAELDNPTAPVFTGRTRKAPGSTQTSVAPRPAYSPAGELVAHQEAGKWDPPLRPRGISPSHLHGGLPTVTSGTVVFCEGHGPAIALNDNGIPAVCSVTGKASAIDATGAAFLYGRTVILSPDAGADEHMDRCGLAIVKVASEVLIAPPWPVEMESNEDAADFIERYGVDAMREHYANATPWTPPEDEEFVAQWGIDVDISEPEALLLGRLHPTDYSILFGDGGVGKGVIAAWWIAQLTRAPYLYAVLILDYEENTRFEWAPRIKQFGGDLARVRIVQTGAAIWDAADLIRAEVDVVHAAFPDAPLYVVVDSIAYACAGTKVEDSTTATKYKKALNAIGHLPTLSLAHTTKADQDPDHPFGSVFWANGARITISASRKDGSREPGTPRLLKCKKSNQRSPFATVEIPWEHELTDETPTTLTEQTPSGELIDRVVAVLRLYGAKTAKGIVAELNVDGYGVVKETSVQTSLTRGKKRSVFVSDGKNPATWDIPAISRGRSPTVDVGALT